MYFLHHNGLETYVWTVNDPFSLLFGPQSRMRLTVAGASSSRVYDGSSVAFATDEIFEKIFAFFLDLLDFFRK